MQAVKITSLTLISQEHSNPDCGQRHNQRARLLVLDCGSNATKTLKGLFHGRRENEKREEHVLSYSYFSNLF